MSSAAAWRSGSDDRCIQSYIQHYGYLAILIGTFLEGETILILAGFAAHRGYLDLYLGGPAAFAGTLAGDQLFFFYRAQAQPDPAEMATCMASQGRKGRRLIKNHQILVILGFRFVFMVLRTVTPFALGIAGVPARLFVPLNFFGALVWATFFGTAGLPLRAGRWNATSVR